MATRYLSPFERQVALCIAVGLTDDEIAEHTERPLPDVVQAVQALEFDMDGRSGVALQVVTNILTAEELPVWVDAAEENRQRLFDAQVVDYTRARLMRRLADPTHWTATIETLGRLERMLPAMVEYELGHLTRVLGSLIVVQVTAYLAPIDPLFWNKTNRNR